MMRRWSALLALSAALSAPTLAAEYTITTLAPAPGFTGVQLFGINNSGQAVGTYISDMLGVTQPFIYGSGGTITPFSGPASALAASALGISDGGVVVGSFFETTVVDPATGDTVAGPSKGFILDGGAFTIVDLGSGTSTELRGISPDGRRVSGYYQDDTGVQLGFVLDRVTGTVTNVSAPGSLFTIAQGINANGVVGGSDVVPTAPGVVVRSGFTYDLVSGVRTTYSFDGYTRTAVRDVSDSGVLAGWLQSADGTVVGFVGGPGSFQTLTVGGASNTTIQSMNESGWLVGNIVLDDGTPLGFVAVPVPEPTTALMLALGAAAVVVTQRRRAAGQAART